MHRPHGVSIWLEAEYDPSITNRTRPDLWVIESIVPAITHEDPRYYTMGQGGFYRRSGYAISRAFVTKTDSGGTSFNWSEVGGNALEAGLSTAYYPPQERGLSQTALNFATQMESAVLNHVFQEFWPDIRRKVFRRK